MDCPHPLDRFQFDNDAVLDDEIRPKPFIETQALIHDRYRDLPANIKLLRPQLVCEHRFVNRLKQTRPKSYMDVVGSIDDASGYIVLLAHAS